MHSIFVYREYRSWKFGLGEGSYWNGNAFFCAPEGAVKRGTAAWAKVKRCLAALIADADILTRRAMDLNSISSKARLRTEDAPGSALASEAMTDRDTNGFSGSVRCELPTTA